MAQTPRLVLIIDDEPEYLEWLSEYLQRKSYRCEYADSLEAAHERLNQKRYALVIADLGIPVVGGALAVLDKQGAVFREFPGLMAARHARNRGQHPGSVIVYSVHRDVRVAKIATALEIRYRLKGRPQDFKRDIDFVLRPRTPKKKRARQ